jgi:hypothetical protein
MNDELCQEILSHPETELNAPASVEMIRAFEHKQKITLPKAHQEFLENANGGVIGHLYVRMYGINTNNALDFTQNINFMGQYIKGTIEKEVLPFAYDGEVAFFVMTCAYPLKNLIIPFCTGTMNTPKSQRMKNGYGRTTLLILKGFFIESLKQTNLLS